MPPAGLHEVVERLNADLASSGQLWWAELLDPVEAREQFPDGREQGIAVGIHYGSDRFAGGVLGMQSSESARSLGLRIVDSVQDTVIDALWAAWPKCQLHEHPLDIVLDRNENLVWECPKLRRTAAPLGSVNHQEL